MSRRWCADCPKLRKKAERKSCKNLESHDDGDGAKRPRRWDDAARVCRQIDPSIVTLYEGNNLNFQELLDIAARRKDGIDRAAHFVHDLQREGPTLSSMALSIHAEIFRGESIGGRFRRPGEDVTFGGERRHERHGAPPSEIEGRLTSIAKPFIRESAGDRSERARDDFLIRSASFLREFFAIHPFKDGNGRVGRLILEAAARAFGPYQFRWDMPFDKRRYLFALQVAHAHAHDNPSREPLVRHPNYHLKRWLEAHLYSTESPSVEEPP